MRAAILPGGCWFSDKQKQPTPTKTFFGGCDFTAAQAADPQRAVAETASKDGCRGRNPGCFG